MELNTTNPHQPLTNYLNPLREELFDKLIAFLDGIGGVENLVISNEMILTDIEFAAERWLGFEADFVDQVSSRTQRMILLKRAKRVVLRRYFQEYIDAIADRRAEIDLMDDDERAGLSDVETIEWDLANYLPEFAGRPASFRRDHAWLLSPQQRFFGEPLSPHDVRQWTKQMLAAAGLTNQSVVYFVSLDDPSKVKIGWTGNLRQKLTVFRNSTPSEPTVRLTLPGGFDLEQKFHRQFKASRIVREWFHLSDEIKAFIAQHPKPKL